MINRISTGALQIVGSEANWNLEGHPRHQSVTRVSLASLVQGAGPGDMHWQARGTSSALHSGVPVSAGRPSEPLLPVTLQVATEGRLDASALPGSGPPGADSELAVKSTSGCLP